MTNGQRATFGFAPGNTVISTGQRATFGSAYTLDGVGNRTRVDLNEPMMPSYNAETINYTYYAGNILASADGNSYTHDANGNRTSKTNATNVTTYTYDSLNRLTQTSTTSRQIQYIYNGLGQRTGKIDNGVQTNYLIDPNGILPQVLAETDTSNNLISFYVYDGAGLVAKISSQNQYYFYHYDGLGSTIAITDNAGQVVNTYCYSPEGLVGAQETIPNPFTYVGRFGVMAEGNGLYLMGARYYDPETGGFISKDPIGYVGGLNLFTYVQNNPVNFIDPLGFKKGDWWDPRTYVTVSISHTLLGKGATQTVDEAIKIYGGKKQQTHSPTTLYGLSIDLNIGLQPSPCDEVSEFGIGIGKHIGLGHFYGRPDKLGNYQIGGLALHIGIGLGLPVLYLSQTLPDQNPDRPFSDLSDLDLHYTAPKKRK